MNKKKLEKLWKKFHPNSLDLGTFEEFLSYMNTKEKRKTFFEQFINDIDPKTNAKFDFGVSSLQEFEKLYGTPPKPKVKRIVPPELKNLENGIKKFQDWLDDNLPNWATGYKDGKINKGQNGGGYGTYGPRTEKAWKTEDIADKFMKFVSTGDEKKEKDMRIGSYDNPATPQEIIDNY